MRTATLSLAFAVCTLLGASAFGDDITKYAPATLADILSPAQIKSIDRRRDAAPAPAGVEYVFTFRNLLNYGNVEVHYLIEEHNEDARIVRRLAAQPSALVYVLQAKRYSDIRAHLTEPEFADVLEQMLAAEKAGDTVRGVKIRRALFDVGQAQPTDFLRDRRRYYDGARGAVAFDRWPEEFRKPTGQFNASIVHTEVWRSAEKSPQIKTLYAKQFFGYLFPVLDEALTPDQRDQIATELKRSNVRTGPVTLALDDVKDYGRVTITYLLTDGVPLPHATAMTSRVTLNAAQLSADPMLVRKFLAPAGANYLVEQVRAGEKAGQKFQSVEIVRILVDVAAKGTPEGDAAAAEFRRNITTYCRQDFLIRPESWPERFRKPDGKFDVELATTSISWKVQKKD